MATLADAAGEEFERLVQQAGAASFDAAWAAGDMLGAFDAAAAAGAAIGPLLGAVRIQISGTVQISDDEEPRTNFGKTPTVDLRAAWAARHDPTELHEAMEAAIQKATKVPNVHFPGSDVELSILAEPRVPRPRPARREPAAEEPKREAPAAPRVELRPEPAKAEQPKGGIAARVGRFFGRLFGRGRKG